MKTTLYLLISVTMIQFAAGCDTNNSDDDVPTKDMNSGDMRRDDMITADMSTDMMDMTPRVPDPSLYTECAPYADKGPFGVGVQTIMYNNQPIEVWYPVPKQDAEGKPYDVYDLRDWLPADFREKIDSKDPTTFTTNAIRDLESTSDKAFPLILFSHGFAGYRLQSSTLTSHMASWGFVVASSEHPERGLAAVLQGDIMGASTMASNDVVRNMYAAIKDETIQSTLKINVDTTQVGVIGHSAGGRTAIEIAPDDFVDAIVGLAPAVVPFGADGEGAIALAKPGLFIIGDQDGITQPEPIKTYFDKQTTNRALIEIKKAGHLAFSDICVIGRSRGGVAQIAVENGISILAAIRKLSIDGCRKTDLLPERAWPIIHHYSTAYFRHHLGVDAQLKGFGERSATCFDGMVGGIDGPK